MAARAPARVIIGIDVGTTGVKVAAFGVGSKWRDVSIREYPLLQPAPGREEQDPAVILEACRQALAECAGRVAGSDVVGLSVSAAMHGLIALDERAAPITPLVTWADSRAIAEAADLRRDGGGRRLHELTGTPVHPMSPLAKLAWFARHDAGVWSKGRWWIGLKELVLHWLTGDLLTELSSASGTGLLDMSTRTWSEEAIAACGVERSRLAAIVSPTERLELSAEVAVRVGLPAGLPVIAGGGDGPLANLGVGAISPATAALSLGTSAAVRTPVAEPKADPDRGLFCYALTDSLWMLGGATSNGGEALRWSSQLLAPECTTQEDVLEIAATAPAGCDGLVMLPYLLPERAPLWDPTLPGCYLGLRQDHSRAHLLRAAVEGACLQLALVFEALGGATPVTDLKATGRALHSPLWRRSLAAALAEPYLLVGEAEGSACGAAALALFALGEADTLGSASRLLESTAEPLRVEPEPELVEVFRDLRDSVPVLVGRLGAVALDLGFGAAGARGTD